MHATAADVYDAARQYVDVLRRVPPGEIAVPEVRGEAVRVIPLEGTPLVFGQGDEANVALAHPLVSEPHAALERGPAGWVVRDLYSEAGTFLNGKAVVRARVRPGDLIQLGPYVFQFKHGALRWLRQPTPLTLAALNLRHSVGTLPLLDDVTLVAEPGEFVGLLGPSGAGKTTLLNALSGVAPAASGHVLLNGESLYEHYDRWRHLIGSVPQEEIVHPELTCRQAFAYAARLRLPADVPADELAAAVEETLETLELTDRADVPVGRLSGGQRKRVSVGIELLGRPRLLFLDEPTSGLDPGTEARLMRLFRELAHQGRTVVCTTHGMENVELFDKIAVLAEGGRLAYFGPPEHAPDHFGTRRVAEVYARLDDDPPAEWQARFRASDPGQALARQAAAERSPREFLRQGHAEPRPARSALAQWLLLTGRFVRVLASDWRTPALMLAQPVLITALICAVFRDLRSVDFLLVVSALWFGCSQAAQQFVKERAVYLRERMTGLGLVPYLLSKFVPLAVVGLLQAVVMLGLVWYFKGAGGVRWVQVLGLTLAGWNGTALGLIVSAFARNPDRATAIVPLSMLPQVMLGGALVALPDMNDATRAAAELCAAKWANQVMEVAAFEGRIIDETLFRGEADVSALWNLYPAYDLRDERGRVQFLAERRGETIRLSGRLALDGAALAGLLLVQLVAAALALRRQDVL